MEPARHRQQINLLIETIRPWLDQRPGGGYASGNMFIYYSLAQARNQDFKKTDFFVVFDVNGSHDRKSWIVWEEEKAPDVIIELLSESTAKYDKSEKKLIYQNAFKTDEYYWYDPYDEEDLTGFIRVNGAYKPLRPDQQGHLISPCLELALVRWRGIYQYTEAAWLRWAFLDGKLLPTKWEQADAEFRNAEAERQRVDGAEAEIARSRAQLENKSE